MVRHASRSPNPNITGPNVPEENLKTAQQINLQSQELYVRENINVHGKPYEENLAVRFIGALIQRNELNPWGKGISTSASV